MKKAKLHIKPKQKLKAKYIYLGSAAFMIAVFVITFLYLNTGNGYKAKAVADTQFSSAELSYTPITGGTVLGNTSNDDDVFNNKSLGFTFKYNGTDYSSVSIATNGFIAMGNSVISTNSPISSASGSNQVISAFGTNLRAQSGSVLRYELIGSEPNRVFVVQWENYRRKVGSTSFSDNFNFQIRLHETTNIIQMVYGEFEFDSDSELTVQIGLRGNSNSNYHNRTNKTSFWGSVLIDWSNPTKGSSNTATSEFIGNFGYWEYYSVPTEGLTYTFLPETLENTWLGYSTNWATSSNWSIDVPNSSRDANIPANPVGGNFPVVSSNETVRHLTINSGASITINNNRSLTVKGNFLNEGTSSTGVGEVVADNNILQWVKGKVGNFNVNKTGSEITLNNDIEITGTLKLTKGTLNLNGKALTINGSVETNTGTITGSNTSDLTITGSGDLGTINFTPGSETIRNLTVNRSAGTITLGTSLTVTNQLTLTNGTVNTGLNYLIVSNPSTSAISGYSNSSYIIGTLRRYINPTGSYDLPVGSSTKGYQFANIKFNSSTGISYIDATFTTGAPSGTQVNVMIDNVSFQELLDNGYWTISPDVENSANYDLTLISQGHENGGLVAGQHTLLKRHDSSSPWEALGDHDFDLNSGNGDSPITVVRRNLTSFSDVGAGVSNGGTLPVKFVDFKGTLNDRSINLNWSTSFEMNNDRFEIERSTDGMMFENIGSIKGIGNSDKLNKYSFTDGKINSNLYYYRIRQVDFNGQSSYSNIIVVEVPYTARAEEFTFDIFPNPGTYDNINLNITSPDKENEFIVMLLGIDGKLIHQENFNSENLKESVKLNLIAPVPPKTYLLKIQQENKSLIKQIIIKE